MTSSIPGRDAAIFACRTPLRRPAALAAAGLAALLSACGGGGGINDGVQPPVASVVSGVVATGAALGQATVRVSDIRGDVVCTTTTDAAGRYSCTLAAGVLGPLAVVARRDDTVLVSTWPTAETGTVNVTPLTTLIAARLVPGGDPAALADAIRLDSSVASPSKVQARIDEVRTLLAPLLAAAGDSLNPITGKFSADGTGHDKVLDLLQVSIRPEAGASNIEITVKVRPASDSAAPLSLAFRSSDAAPPPLRAAISTDALPVTGSLDDLLRRLAACHAEPLSLRVRGVEPGATAATGGPADVTSAVCRGLFVDDDPAAYKDNGQRVGSSGAFASLFSDAATGASFDRPNLEYQWANGDVLVSYRSTTRSGEVANGTLTVRRQGGQLKAVGNQYRYEALVRPTATYREFPAQPRFSWFGTGYSANIRNAVDPQTRLPLFREAYLTSPDGRRTVFRPLPGTTNLGILQASGRQTSTAGLMLASAYADPATPGSPAQKDGNGGATFVDPPLDEAALRALPDQGVWTIEWVHADASQPNVVQSYRTLSRAPTLGEVRQQKWVELTAAFKAELLARSDVATQGRVVFGAPSADLPNLPTFATAAGGDAWVVPDGTLAPRTLNVFGTSASGGAYSNSLALQPTDRQGRVPCRTLSVNDLHCDTSLGLPQYAEGTRFNYFNLAVTTPRQLLLTREFGLYRLAE